MSTKKKYDLAVKTGSYTNSNGDTKGKYKNCGSVMEKDDNSKFLLIDPTFNFAGVKREDGRDMVIVSMFEPKQKDGNTWDNKQNDGGESSAWENESTQNSAAQTKEEE